MATSQEWSFSYARQASADFDTYEVLQSNIAVPKCHALQFLQMACEKLVKAHLCGSGSDLVLIQSSHAYVAKGLPRVLREQAARWGGSWKKLSAVERSVRKIAREVELLAPSVDDNGQRPDNCEYPWVDHTSELHSPLDWSFAPSGLLLEQGGLTVLKLIRGAIDRLLANQKSGRRSRGFPTADP